MRILVAGIKEIDESKFRRTTDALPNGICDMSVLNKPNGCLWGSTMTPNDYYLSDWLRWVSEEEFHIEKYEAGAISFTLKKKAKVCEISSVEDYKNLMKKYFKKKYKNEPYDRNNAKIIDWEMLSRDYDAFHLTENAFWKMRLPWDPDILKDEDGIYLENFYSYDCESWILFNLDCINKGSIMNHCVKDSFRDYYD